MIPDGDDSLVGTQVLKLFNYHFQMEDVWVVWSNCFSTYNKGVRSNQPKDSKMFEENKVRNQFTLTPMHLRAVYTKLWRQVQYKDLLDKSG